MLFVDEIMYRHLTAADFRNIEGIKKPDGGGGQTYIDLSGIDPNEAVEFFKYCQIDEDNLKAKEIEEGTPPYRVDLIQTGGVDCEYNMQVYRRRPKNYTIRDQFNNRFPGWSVRAGFPTIVGEGKPFCAGGSYDNDETDPYVQPIIAHLTIYIVRTINRLYFADYLSDAEIPKAWPLGFGLEKLLKASENEKAAGIIKPRGLIEFVNRRESVSAK